MADFALYGAIFFTLAFAFYSFGPPFDTVTCNRFSCGAARAVDIFGLVTAVFIGNPHHGLLIGAHAGGRNIYRGG